MALGDAGHPHRVAVEVADNGSDLVGRLFEYGTVGNFHHRYPRLVWRTVFRSG
jgi:hypothetical protein